MDPIFRPDLTRVVITGSESVGKTTLARDLAHHFGTVYVPEFVREYAATKKDRIDFGDHGVIARGQMALENRKAEEASRVLFQDTDLLSTVVYCEHYFGRCPRFIVDSAFERRGDLYLLLPPDVPWVPDGIRDRGTRREEMHTLFRERLEELGMPFVQISGDFGERWQKALAEVNKLLGSVSAGGRPS